MFWQEGAVTLLIAAPLAAERLIPLGCRQTAAGPLPPPRTGESSQFECFSPDATVELSLARRRGASSCDQHDGNGVGPREDELPRDH